MISLRFERDTIVKCRWVCYQWQVIARTQSIVVATKNTPAKMCDCPMCMPSGEVNARRFRERVKSRMRADGLAVESDMKQEIPT